MKSNTTSKELLQEQNSKKEGLLARTLTTYPESHESLTSMFLLLPSDGSCYDLQQLLVAGPAPHGVPQRHLGSSKQTHLEVAVCRQPQPVAAGTEVLTHRRDEAHLTSKAGNLVRLYRVFKSTSQEDRVA